MTKGRPAKLANKADDRPQRALAVPVAAPMMVPEMPESLPAEALETWQVICTSLPGLDIQDLGDVEICVSALHQYRSISKLLADNGVYKVVTDPETGDEMMYVPDAVLKLDRMKTQAANTYRYHADQLGLSRMSRARLNLLDLAGKSELVSLAERVAGLRAK